MGPQYNVVFAELCGRQANGRFGFLGFTLLKFLKRETQNPKSPLGQLATQLTKNNIVLGPHRLMGTHDKRPSMKGPFDFGQTFITAKWNSWQRVPTLILGLRVKWNFRRCVRHHFAAVEVNIGVMKVLTKL